MNRLKFNGGGQPVYLDDLDTLQQNSLKAWQGFLKVLTMGAGVFLLEDVEQEEQSDGTTVFGGGTLVVDGMPCSFNGAALKVDKDKGAYLLVNTREADRRVFEDGQTRACATATTVVLAATATGADKAYRLTEVQTLLDLMEQAMEANKTRNNVAVTWLNGYSGKVNIVERDGDTMLTLDIKTANTTWGPDKISKGLLLVIEDEKKAMPFKRKTTKSFVYDNREYKIGIGSGPGEPALQLQLASGTGSYYEDSYVLPVIPVKGTFKLSECTQG